MKDPRIKGAEAGLLEPGQSVTRFQWSAGAGTGDYVLTVILNNQINLMSSHTNRVSHVG